VSSHPFSPRPPCAGQALPPPHSLPTPHTASQARRDATLCAGPRASTVRLVHAKLRIRERLSLSWSKPTRPNHPCHAHPLRVEHRLTPRLQRALQPWVELGQTGVAPQMTLQQPNGLQVCLPCLRRPHPAATDVQKASRPATTYLCVATTCPSVTVIEPMTCPLRPDLAGAS
jgi:hypothetical protein